ncbi:hypothetical protein GXM_02026 [Nostoc sphaeroides CCNUC1]|uniref:Uncharacterized protein n=1 Tax=Nostoc sphaeroides CCNUC1 TaxID=2653204 RepID=A0A5P8VW17_9NOSO|nr:hypothetical protein GXM_02026 [Nostoc sphaeroides CCNUC1]
MRQAVLEQGEKWRLALSFCLPCLPCFPCLPCLSEQYCFLWGQYGSVKPKDAINRRQDKGLIIVQTAIYRVFVI